MLTLIKKYCVMMIIQDLNESYFPNKDLVTTYEGFDERPF